MTHTPTFTPKRALTATAIALAFALNACGNSDVKSAADKAADMAHDAGTHMEHAADTAKDMAVNAMPKDLGDKQFTADIITNDRSVIGSLRLTQQDTQIAILVKVSGIAPGEHGVHFHAVGDCSDDKFLNTKSHINPMGKMHGLNHDMGPDNADLPNLVADENGNVEQLLVTTRLSFTGTSPEQPALFDADGSALVIHANEDDQVTQPIGGAGARIGCAAISR